MANCLGRGGAPYLFCSVSRRLVRSQQQCQQQHHRPYSEAFRRLQQIPWDVKENVNQIDAWLVTDGNVNTCTEFTIGSGSSEQCTNPLIINGPVVAKSLSLNRTAGANPGSGAEDTSNVLYKNLANDGSVTPGEIFNLRPDTLYWAYGQSQRFSQANVTYTRELAPRY